MMNILIKNARLVNEGEVREGDLLMRDGRIARIGGEILADGAEVIDAAGRVLMPGMIDDQVHFREPGVTHKADIASESKAALAGGITSFFDMPNTRPQTVTLEALEDKFRLAAGRAWGNFAFYLGGTNDNIEEIRRLAPGQTCGVKVFMGASTGNMLVDDPATLEAIFRDCPTLIATHCEDTPTILANEARYREQYGEQIPMRFHPAIRSEAACWKSSSMAVDLARRHGTRLHVLHLTTARELALFEAGPLEGKRITAEACVHHLYFSDADYEALGSQIKCNPAIKTAEDRAALRAALAEDRLDVIATDHAPHTWEEKQDPSYFKAPAGLPLVQHALCMALELVHDGLLGLPQLVHKVAHAPARLFGIRDRGFLREGYHADLVLVDLDAPQSVRREDVLYKCGWSPLEGRTLRSSVIATFVNGELKYDRGHFLGGPNGARLEFAAD
ncbi:dihydroorotase [endosymbiont of unidentified scaly snail isolate Monju]|uniref:dihydroorotase n=1 Tax=endosymbiont of unidentified scaly snail isolate Monju TaxID=1248727 RepID=UPI0005B9F177|nr:dihydroorotase [endosymbiont of unidentified scaly snail isolate Monju]